MDIPRIYRVRQKFTVPDLPNPAGTTRHAILQSNISQRLKPGSRVAITAGSRGIAGIAGILKAVVDACREHGFEPFIVGAMGSHGGATAEGQRELLAEFGITSQAMACEVLTEMETVALGTNSFGLPICFDANAHAADGIIVVNRLKPHTSFTGRYESGLLKMLAIGLGKREGASQVHKLGLPGLQKLIPEVGTFLLKNTNVVLGLAILENAREHTAEIVAVEPEEILEKEPVLLDRAREIMGRLPFDQIDFLVVGELGKNYSGTGMDPNVIGRQRVETMPDLPRPQVTRLAVLDLAVEAHGNGLGVGLADLTTRRFVSKIDPKPMQVNSFTSNFLTRARVPLAMSNDMEVITTGLDTCWRIDRNEARMVLVPNTLELEHLYISEALVEEATGISSLEISPEPADWCWDVSGNIDQARLFPHANQGRRLARASH
jgi:hypothetical protein